MSFLTRRQLLSGAGALAATGLCVPATAQTARPGTLRLLVGFPPGGTADVLARALQPALQTRRGEPVIVENKPGAGGRLGVAELKNAAADGHTVMVSADPILTIYPHVFPRLAYDTAADILPLVPLASEPVGLCVGPMVPAGVRTLADFLAWCKANPKQAAYTTAAAGTTMHFVGAQLAHASGTDLLHVPHRGGAAAVQDVVGGQIASTMTSMSLALPHLASGRLRCLGVSTPGRYTRLPDVPSFAEAGHKDVVAQVYYATWLKAGTPPATVAALAEQMQAVAAMPDVAALLDKLGLDRMSQPQPAFAQRVSADLRRWGPIVKATGYSADD
jgi:tripartite-type tricarboxylate transporter receptor subunit TctC